MTIVRCAVVWPVSISAQRARSSTATDLAGRGQQIRRGQPGDAAADDHDVHVLVAASFANAGIDAESIQYGVVCGG